MNTVIISGNLTKDIDLRATQSNIYVTNFTVAVRENEDTTYFLDCVAWKGTAELLNKYAKKGSKVLVQGRITKRSYEHDGTTKYVTEIVAERVELLDKKNDRVDDTPSEEPKLSNSVEEEDLPF